MVPSPQREAIVIVPIRSFDDAKSRLSDVLDPQERTSLVRSMAEQVVRAAHDLPVLIVSDDPEVIQWAESVGAEPSLQPGMRRGPHTAAHPPP